MCTHVGGWRAQHLSCSRICLNGFGILLPEQMAAEIKHPEPDRVRQRAVAMAGQAGGICLLVAMRLLPTNVKTARGGSPPAEPRREHPRSNSGVQWSQGPPYGCGLGSGNHGSLVTLGETLPPTLSPVGPEVELKTIDPGVF